MTRIDDDVKAVLTGIAWPAADLAVIHERLDRKMYERTNKVLEALGGKWNRKRKGHVFDDDGRTAFEEAAATGEYADWKKINQFFETPSELAARMCELALVDHDSWVLEPSAGKGRIVQAALDCGAKVTAVERESTYGAHVLRMATGSEELLNVILNEDFLGLTPDPSYDAVVMNPPFRSQDDMRHVTKAAAWLRPGGRLVSVMSPAWRFRTTAIAENFRGDLGKAATWEPLPEGTFKDSGTMVNTGLFTWERPT